MFLTPQDYLSLLYGYSPTLDHQYTKKLVHQTWKQAHFLVLDTTHHQRTSRPDRFELSDLCTNKIMERGLFQQIKKLISKIMYFQIKAEKLLANFDIQKLVFCLWRIGSLRNKGNFLNNSNFCSNFYRRVQKLTHYREDIL